MRNDVLVAQRRGAAARALGNATVAHRQAAKVGLVDDGIAPGYSGWPILAPVETVDRYHGLGHGERAITAIKGQICPRRGDAIAVKRVAPAQ